MPAPRLANAVFGHALLGDATLRVRNIDCHLKILLIFGGGGGEKEVLCGMCSCSRWDDSG
jgi:hypothetical protein